MVFDRRIALRQPLKPFAKGFVKGLAGLVLVPLSGSLLSCSSNRPAPQPAAVAPSLQSMSSSSGLRITSIGNNRGGRFSNDGRRILFLSSRREFHRNWQLYELDLETFRERRITYHDGDCLEAEYAPRGDRLLYASTTDEIKERPALLHPKANSDEKPPTDLYLSDLKGMQIERLTQAAGFQGQAAWIGPTQLLYASETGPGRLELDSVSLPSMRSSSWKTGGESSLELPTVDSSGTQIAWLIKDKGAATVRLGLKMKGRALEPLATPFRDIQSLQWVQGPERQPLLLISAQRAEDNFLKGWLLDPQKQCAQLLLQEPGSLKDLRAGPRQEKLLYTYEAAGSSQLFLREFPNPSSECQPLSSFSNSGKTQDPLKAAP